MKIFLIGCVESSYVFMNALLNNGAEIVGVITKSRSKFNSDFVDITPLCEKYRIPYCCVDNVDNESSKEFIRSCSSDICYCLGWSQLISTDVIDLFPLGVVGYHPAHLPNNRGRHPIIWALALGLTNTASSFFMLEETADTGDIVSQELVEIEYDDNARTLMDKLLEIGSKQIVTITKQFERNSITRIPQDNRIGNSWRKRGRLDGQIDWRMSSYSIYNLVRALSKPYIGAHFVLGDDEVKVWKVKEVKDIEKKYVNIEPGKVVNIIDDSIIIKVGDGLIELVEYDSVKLEVGEYLR